MSSLYYWSGIHTVSNCDILNYWSTKTKKCIIVVIINRRLLLGNHLQSRYWLWSNTSFPRNSRWALGKLITFLSEIHRRRHTIILEDVIRFTRLWHLGLDNINKPYCSLIPWPRFVWKFDTSVFFLSLFVFQTDRHTHTHTQNVWNTYKTWNNFCFQKCLFPNSKLWTFRIWNEVN